MQGDNVGKCVGNTAGEGTVSSCATGDALPESLGDGGRNRVRFRRTLGVVAGVDDAGDPIDKATLGDLVIRAFLALSKSNSSRSLLEAEILGTDLSIRNWNRCPVPDEPELPDMLKRTGWWWGARLGWKCSLDMQNSAVLLF